jgi:hypothetical protein
MICAIHQPQYMPWLGYFDKMARADVFVLLDDVQFKKNEWQNRNRIRISNDPGWQWLTVPVLHEFGQIINAVRLNPAIDWRAQHMRALETNYGRSVQFRKFWPAIRPFYEREWETLGELNIALVQLLAGLLGIKTPLVIASTLNILTTKTQRLIDICRAVGCDAYLAGAGAEAYMDFDDFRASGLKLDVQRYVHPVYPQARARSTEQFISHLSAVDCLFNGGF